MSGGDHDFAETRFRIVSHDIFSTPGKLGVFERRIPRSILQPVCGTKPLGPEFFGAEDIVLISSIAPVVFWLPDEADPYDVNYHMIVGGADTDASGSPRDPRGQPSTAIYERATGNKQLLYVQGAGHADFHGGEGNPPPSAFGQPPNWAFGPDLIGREAAHTVMKGYYLPLLELYAKDNVAAKELAARLEG